MDKTFVIIVMCSCMIGCESRDIRPAEEILRENYMEGGLTMWVYDVKEKSAEQQQRIKQSLIDDATRILDAYLLLECTNQTQFSCKSEKVVGLIDELSRPIE